MFEWLKKYNKILVTGPQRSGTRVCAQMIAFDTGYSYIDENELYMDSLYTLCSFLDKKKPLVIQCPVLCRYIHHFYSEDRAIILMNRKVDDIIASQKRIDWGWEWLERARYDSDEGNIAEIKYRFWEKFQKHKIKHAFEIEYESLSDHPLWIPKNKRKKFMADQISEKSIKDILSSDFKVVASIGTFLYKEKQSDKAILFKTNQSVKKLNQTATFIWELCNKKRKPLEILKELKIKYPEVEEKKLKEDLQEFLEDLLYSGFLQLRSNLETKKRNKKR